MQAARGMHHDKDALICPAHHLRKSGFARISSPSSATSLLNMLRVRVKAERVKRRRSEHDRRDGRRCRDPVAPHPAELRGNAT
jgi:hypothetical protein